MKNISGITFIKNGLTLGYPIKESIESIRDFCDEVVINVGFEDEALTKDDGTYEYLRDHFSSDKYVFLKNWWNPKLSIGGEVLAQQTNLALAKARGKYVQYIQGDECLHENDIPAIEEGVRKLERDSNAFGLVYSYHHFYGNVNIVKQTKKTYRHEIRMIRNFSKIKSWKDAQGFRFNDNTKLPCYLTNARVYHYGWARNELVMNRKVQSFGKLYHGHDYSEQRDFTYRRVWGIRPFKGTHPKYMKNWIETNKNDVDIFKLKPSIKLKDTRIILSDLFEYVTGKRLGEYKNYKVID